MKQIAAWRSQTNYNNGSEQPQGRGVYKTPDKIQEKNDQKYFLLVKTKHKCFYNQIKAYILLAFMQKMKFFFEKQEFLFSLGQCKIINSVLDERRRRYDFILFIFIGRLSILV